MRYSTGDIVLRSGPAGLQRAVVREVLPGNSQPSYVVSVGLIRHIVREQDLRPAVPAARRPSGR